jgi:hypothetical protein
MNILDPIFYHTLFYDFRQWTPWGGRPQEANQSHSIGLLECRGMWRWVARLPASTKAFLILQVLVTTGVKIGFRRRRLVGGPGFEKVKVASWHIQTLPHYIPSTCAWVCPYSHLNLVGKRPTWKLTCRGFICFAFLFNLLYHPRV